MFGFVQCPISGDPLLRAILSRDVPRAQVPAPVAVEAPGAKETSKAASRRSSETAIAAKAEKAGAMPELSCWGVEL